MKTFSICNNCYKKIPANVEFIDGMVKLSKNCCGTDQQEIIERNIAFYKFIFNMRLTNILENLCNIAITEDCNTTCMACYCKMGKTEKTIDEIMCLAHCSPLWINKFILTGGEPTVHSKFFEIISQLNCGIITNGIKFKDINFLKEFAKHKVYWIDDSNEMAIMFSLNTKDSPNYEDKLEALENIRRMGLKVGIISATIIDLEEIPDILAEFKKLKDVSSTFKIRSAFNIGESKGFKHIYLSEIVDFIKKRVNVFRFIDGLNNHTYLINTRCDDIHLILVKCPDKTTLDMRNIGPVNPYQFTHFGTFENTMVALIINEGIENGYFNGIKMV